MLLPISSIKPAPDPIRRTWDEEKLNELAQSIAEQGLIVPIKVRPHPEVEACEYHGFISLSADESMDSVDQTTDCIECRDLRNAFWGQENLEHEWWEYEEGEIEPARPFEVVYGHRRLEAVRRNGATEIECIVDGVDDTGALVQALIENIQREDMTPIDIAKSLKAMQDAKGWSSYDFERNGVMAASVARRTLQLLTLSPDIQEMIGGMDGSVKLKPLTGRSVDAAKAVDQGDLRENVLRKAAREELNVPQIRNLAESIAAAPSPEAKKMLLETEYSPALHDPEHIKARAQTYGAHDPLYRTDNGKTQQKAWDNTPEVKMIIDGVINAAKSWTMLIAEIRRMVEVGKMAPEGRQFTASKLRSLAQTLTAFADELEQEKELEHA